MIDDDEMEFNTTSTHVQDSGVLVEKEKFTKKKCSLRLFWYVQ